MANVKNYTEQGGEKTVIGGTLDLTDATVVGVVTAAVKNNLTTTATGSALDAAQGKVLKNAIDAKVAANQAASTGETSPTTAEFNTLLAALKTAGLMVAD